MRMTARWMKADRQTRRRNLVIVQRAAQQDCQSLGSFPDVSELELPYVWVHRVVTDTDAGTIRPHAQRGTAQWAPPSSSGNKHGNQ
jgi:hypothetical protein